MQLGAIFLYYSLESTLHVSGALYIHHQECLKTVHAVIGKIVCRYGVRSGLLQDDHKSGAYAVHVQF
jgi:hypothetical protein